MGISRDSQHKRRLTGGKKPHHHKKRKHEMGRQMAMTKIGAKRVHPVRCRGGNIKFRALRLDTGNFSWGSEVCTRKTRILDVVYNASNNELVRTKTLVKNAIVQIDATPYRQWYEAHYGVVVGKKRRADDKEEEKKKLSTRSQAKITARQEGRQLDPNINSQFDTGRLLACISSRPGQCGRCDGYVLEGKELEFYVKRMAKKKK
uniref:40S ribosomal protein S8 n=1 Tax=Chrysotila carterae TaxID=13221 RepID=A0A7S4F7M8_CHRCT